VQQVSRRRRSWTSQSFFFASSSLSVIFLFEGGKSCVTLARWKTTACRSHPIQPDARTSYRAPRPGREDFCCAWQHFCSHSYCSEKSGT
jgi:hypothetical protein